MAGIYFDAVLDDNYSPVFNGTPEETAEWLRGSDPRFTNTYRVCRGVDMQMIEIPKYLEDAKFRETLEKVREIIENGKEEWVLYEFAMVYVGELKEDTRKNRDKIFEILKDVVEVGDPNANACEAARKLMELIK